MTTEDTSLSAPDETGAGAAAVPPETAPGDALSILMALGWCPEIGTCVRVHGEPWTVTAYLRRDQDGLMRHCSRTEARYLGVGVPFCRVVRLEEARFERSWPSEWSRDLPDFWERVAREHEGLRACSADGRVAW